MWDGVHALWAPSKANKGTLCKLQMGALRRNLPLESLLTKQRVQH